MVKSAASGPRVVMQPILGAPEAVPCGAVIRVIRWP